MVACQEEFITIDVGTVHVGQGGCLPTVGTGGCCHQPPLMPWITCAKYSPILSPASRQAASKQARIDPDLASQTVTAQPVMGRAFQARQPPIWRFTGAYARPGRLQLVLSQVQASSEGMQVHTVAALAHQLMVCIPC